MGTDKARRRTKRRGPDLASGPAGTARTSSGASPARPAATPGQVLRMALQMDAKWTKESFPEFYEVLFWLRLGLALVMGVLCGSLPITGSLGVIAFPTLTIAGISAYYTYYLGIEEDDFGAGELLKEGLAVSIVVYMLVWTATYTAIYGGA